MNIEIIRNGSGLTVIPEGRIDSQTAPELEKKIFGNLGDAAQLMVDLSRVSYISSAGLRVLLGCAHAMDDRRGGIRTVNVSDTVRKTFDITGFLDILNVE